MHATVETLKSNASSWVDVVIKHQNPNLRKSLWQLLNSYVPFVVLRKFHALHHARAGNLDRRSDYLMADIYTLTEAMSKATGEVPGDGHNSVGNPSGAC
jgi:hypothetical protein